MQRPADIDVTSAEPLRAGPRSELAASLMPRVSLFDPPLAALTPARPSPAGSLELMGGLSDLAWDSTGLRCQSTHASTTPMRRGRALLGHDRD